MSDCNKTPTFITAPLTFSPEPEDCFFTLDCGTNWCPGWAIARLTLPFAVYSNVFCLVWDSTGTTHWVTGNKVKKRGDCHRFEFAYYQKFDWKKWQTFTPITEGYIPTAGNVWKESDRLSIGEHFEF